MSGYLSFSGVYDALMQDTDYKKRAAYLVALFSRYSAFPTGTVLDLGCGTASMLAELTALGYDVIGVDASSDMLALAMEKCAQFDQKPLLLCQDITQLDLYGTVDVAVSCLDVLNHLTDENQLKLAFERLKNFIEPDGLFVFDVNTPYKHTEILDNNVFITDNDNIFCVWSNNREDDSLCVTMDLDIFVRENDRYLRIYERIVERAYPLETITTLLEGAGFEVLDVFDDMTFEKLKNESERAVFVARNVGRKK